MSEEIVKEEKEVLLSVRHLEQYFKSGKYVNHAVDDVNFDIYKGEVFGLVGESGCGKTTTGRSIIRLYDITGGSVYFKGQRICAGTRRYKAELKAVTEEYNQKIAALQKDTESLSGEAGQMRAEREAKISNLEGAAARNEAQIAALKAERDEKIAALKAEIASAKKDHKNCNKNYAAKEQERVKAEFAPRIAAAKSDEERAALQAEYKKQLTLAKKDRIMNKVQMIFQDPIASLDPRMTVRELIAEGLIIRGIRDKKTIDEMVYHVLDLVGLVPEHAGRYPHEFSGGQKQRIGIARAIILNPELIIADEPISALDVSIQAQVINLLNDLRNTLGLTILFIAHDLSVVKYFSDRIAVMYFGKIVELATSDELFAHPLHPYTRSLLSAIPLPDPRTEKHRQRIVYNPIAEHDYSVEKPTMREVAPGHFVRCNQPEFEKYQEMLKD